MTPLAAFCGAIGWEGGRVEVVAGTNRPGNLDKIDLLIWNTETFGTSAPHTRRWIAPDDVRELEKVIGRLAAQWGNVYTSVGTYDEVPNRHKPGQMTTNRSAPRPRYGFVLDDVTDLSALRLPPTWATETSPGNYQAGYRSTTLLSPRQAVMLGKGAMLLAGSDPSGCDAEQIVRVPGGLNTKPKCIGRAGDPKAGIEPEGWPVRLVFADGPRYTMQQLAEAFLPGGLVELGAARHSSKAEKPAAPADLELLARLPDGAALMNTPRYRAQFRNRPQLAQLARGEAVMLPTKYGLRGSGSEQVAVLVINLLTYGRPGSDGKIVQGLEAPPLDEIRAIALFWRDRLRPGYNLGRYVEDVERLIVRYTPAGYAPQATKYTSESIPSRRALLPPTRPGRPQARETTAQRVLDRIRTLPASDDGYVHIAAPVLAKVLSLSVPYIRMLLSDLRESGQLATRQEARGLALRVITDGGAIDQHPCEGTNQLSDEGTNRPLADRIDTPQKTCPVGGEYTPPPAPATEAATEAAAAGGVSPLRDSLSPDDDPAAWAALIASGPPAWVPLDDQPAPVIAPVPVLVAGNDSPGRPISANELCEHFSTVTLAALEANSRKLRELIASRAAAATPAAEVPLDAEPVKNIAPAPIAPQEGAQTAVGQKRDASTAAPVGEISRTPGVPVISDAARRAVRAAYIDEDTAPGNRLKDEVRRTSNAPAGPPRTPPRTPPHQTALRMVPPDLAELSAILEGRAPSPRVEPSAGNWYAAKNAGTATPRVGRDQPSWGD